MIKQLVLTSICLLLGTTSWARPSSQLPCESFDGTGADGKPYNEFADRLIEAIVAHNGKTLAQYTRFPIRAKIGTKIKTINSSEELEKNFSRIFTSSFISKLDKNDAEDVVCNYQGIGLANGMLWFKAIDTEKKPIVIKVTAINN
jgi:hypothetical protein